MIGAFLAAYQLTAGVKIVDCIIFKGQWRARAIFDSIEVDTISSHFRPEEQRPDPFPLIQNKGISFSGHYLMGQGFLVTPSEAEELILKNPANADVIFDYIKGDELNNTAHQTIPLKAINFGFRDLPEIENNYPEALEIVRHGVREPRQFLVRQGQLLGLFPKLRLRPLAIGDVTKEPDAPEIRAVGIDERRGVSVNNPAILQRYLVPAGLGLVSVELPHFGEESVWITDLPQNSVKHAGIISGVQYLL